VNEVTPYLFVARKKMEEGNNGTVHSHRLLNPPLLGKIYGRITTTMKAMPTLSTTCYKHA
jgi:hypothetical protein